MAPHTDDVRHLAEQAEDHDLVERFARLGLLSRAVVWTLIGVLAGSVAFGVSGAQETDPGGALRAVGQTPGGTAVLVALAVGFLAYSGYRVLCAAVGFRHERGAERLLHRLQSGGEVALYLVAAWSCVRTALGQSPDSEQETRSLTATVMSFPGGRTAVGLAGAVAVVVAVVLFVRALRHHHAGQLENVPPRCRRAVVWLGVAGLGGRSLAIGLIGGFLVNAARQFDPNEAKGLDAALDTLREQPFGPWLLLLAAAALLCYGLWSFAETAWRQV